MSVIGKFKHTGEEIVGNINTLSIKAQNVRIVPEDPASDEAPTHRVYCDDLEIGAAWSKTSAQGRKYLSLKLDDLSFPAPIFASLFSDDNGDYSLVWNRHKPSTS